MFLFALAGAISPGPVNLVAASLGASAGFCRALPHVAGASLSYAAIVWLMGDASSYTTGTLVDVAGGR
jgi:threonine/homoserine/homoserine lactone efflux protein